MPRQRGLILVEEQGAGKRQRSCRREISSIHLAKGLKPSDSDALWSFAIQAITGVIAGSFITT